MNTFTRLILALAAFFLVFISNANAVNSPTIDRIQKSGKLVVGTSGTMPLMSEKLMTGEFAGFDIDMAKALAETMGVKLEIKSMSFSQLIPALEKGKVDVVLSNMTMTIERNMRVAFAGPYFVSGKCLITKEKAMSKAGGPDDLKESNASIAVAKGSTSEEFVKVLMPKVKRIVVANVDEGTDMVSSGKANAYLTDFPICLGIVKRYPHSYESVVSLLTYEPIGIAVPANDPLLLNLAENFIKRAEGVGLMKELLIKWFGQAKFTAIKSK